MGVLHLLSGKKKKAPFSHKGSGFTLVEMAAVMVIAGTLMSGALIGIPQYINNLKAKQTQRKMDLVMNALSVYSQRNFRLPCPADTVGGTRGAERDNGYCFENTSDRQLYSQTEGVVPWKALGLAERDVIDGWGHYITYKPAPQLTANTYAPEMQSADNGLDIHNACRTKVWYNGDGTIHVNRQKALFCCNASPKESYLDDLQPNSSKANAAAGIWRRNSVGAAGAYGDNGLGNNDPVVSSNAWIDDYNATDATNGDPYLAGGFGTAFTADADASLLRASGQAVTLISHGSNGYFSYIRKQNGTTRLDASLDQADGLTFNGTLSADEGRNVWPPEQFSASLYHPKASGGGAYDRSGLRAGASDDMVAWARSDQLFSRAGNATCVRPTAVNATCPLFNYGNFMYVFDTSGSMAFTDFDGGKTRVSAVKSALLGNGSKKGVLEQQIRGEARNDDDPDNIGFTGLIPTNKDLTVAQTLLNIDSSGDPAELTDPDVVESAINKGKSRVSTAASSGNTPLFHTMLEAAAVIGNGTESEPTALLMLSDGEDNASNMDNKAQMYSTVRSKFKDLTMSQSIIAAKNNPSISREQMFGMIMKENYPNMVVHVVDVRPGGNTGLAQMVQSVGGSSRYMIANDQTALDEFLALLSGVCESEVAGGP